MIELSKDAYFRNYQVTGTLGEIRDAPDNYKPKGTMDVEDSMGEINKIKQLIGEYTTCASADDKINKAFAVYKITDSSKRVIDFKGVGIGVEDSEALTKLSMGHHNGSESSLRNMLFRIISDNDYQKIADESFQETPHFRRVTVDEVDIDNLDEVMKKVLEILKKVA